ncbi:MAG: cob(I)yrinic acid a,c-diamide adenosyltransferase [Chitinophagales bacterium]|nr:cob(I)yrinic acid a,c-diamide adenosyltransferase [Chitinophagales bacterium]
MKIYTKTGDKGTTGLFGGKRLPKDDLRIEAYGTVDELNAFVGTLNTAFEHEIQNDILSEIQRRLFTIGSNLASDPDKEMITPDLTAEDITELEYAMDNMEEELLPLRNFVLPGGHHAAALAHVCRTVCRRAERRVISLDRVSTVDPIIVQYLNRLSDYFFMLSRYIVHIHGAEEVAWIPRKG